MTSVGPKSLKSASAMSTSGSKKRTLIGKQTRYSKTDQMNYLKGELEMDDHIIPLEELCVRFSTDPERGLTHEKAVEILQRDGLNTLTPPKQTPKWWIFLKTMFAGFAVLMWIGGILCFVAYFVDLAGNPDASRDNLYLGFVLIGVVVVTGCFTFYQENNASKVMDSFKNLIPLNATVIRDGTRQSIPAEQVVVGDLVKVQSGDKVPADIRVIKSQGFKVDNSSLTGESEPLLRTGKPTSEEPLETKNLIFFSTFAVEGTCLGIVFSTGDRTMMGKIAHLASAVDHHETPISKELKRFAQIISTFAVAVGVIFFLVTLSMGFTLLQSSIFLIGVVVANVPEGLLPTVTVCLTLTAKRMAKKQCLVKNLQGVETLGSTSTICSDKTGTLTQNVMTVSHIWFNREIYEADNSENHSNAKYNLADEGFTRLLRVAALCSRAEFKHHRSSVPVQKREVDGDASEAALLKFVEITTGNASDFRANYKKEFEIPFNSTNKFQISIHKLPDDPLHEWVLVMKGAPEIIIEHCATHGSNTSDLDESFHHDFQEAYDTLGGMGERVLGFCDFLLPNFEFPADFVFTGEPPNFPLKNLNYAGLMSLIDPPKPNVPEAVLSCRSAGIKVVMVTGDHPITARAIARSVHIISDDSETVEEVAKRKGIPINQVNEKDAVAVVVTGPVLRNMSMLELQGVIRAHKEIVFARTSPQQKLFVVESFQQLGAIVAVTGDGVNDSPALKKGDIGISMGITGSDVTKQVADMILLDDNFASIVNGIEEGRKIFDNLKKSIAYALAINVPEIIPFLLYVLLNIPMPLGLVHMLALCLGTDIFPAISLAYERAESDIMTRKPRNPFTEHLVTDKLLSRSYGMVGMILAIGGMFAYSVHFAQCGFLFTDLLNTREEFESPEVNDLVDSYGQEWTYDQRHQLTLAIQSSVFADLVVMQLGNLISNKCRRNLLYQQGFGNCVLNIAMLFEIILVCVLLYSPGTSHIMMSPIKPLWWLPTIGFMLLIIGLDELRRFVMLKPWGSWVYKETFA